MAEPVDSTELLESDPNYDRLQLKSSQEKDAESTASVEESETLHLLKDGEKKKVYSEPVCEYLLETLACKLIP